MSALTTLDQRERLILLDRKVDAAEGDGILARWEFGRELLTEIPAGKKQLREGRLDEVAEDIGKSRQEVGRRLAFAKRFPTEDEVSHVVRNFHSWHEIANECLASTAHLSANKDEWATPQWLYDALDAEFRFTLDVCASDTNAKHERHYTALDDGLLHNWEGETAFMNPPYSEIGEWMGKAFNEAGRDTTVVCVVPSRTDVEWFWQYARHGQIRFLRGRQHFVDDLGNTGPAPFPSAVVVFGPQIKPGSVVWWER